MIRDDFAVLILSHGRADNVKTLKTLMNDGYTGRWYIVIDDEDDQAEEYFMRFGDHVVQFEKDKYVRRTDTMDALDGRNVVVFARNATFDIADDLGLTFFLVLDDDYTAFNHRYVSGGKLVSTELGGIDLVFDEMCEFLYTSGALTVAMAQGGDLLGGAESKHLRTRIIRKAMNSFFCMTERRFDFMGRINEDTNAYVIHGATGGLFFTVVDLSLVQTQTQKSAGGLTEAYLDLGTYVKSFYTILGAPSCVQIRVMGGTHTRLHHHVMWDYAVPKILSGRYRKF